MLILLICLVIIPIIGILIKLALYLIVKKYGKFSYDGFSAAGFAYNSEKDIFYSTKNAWQKNFGYTRLYDVLAPIFRMIIDTEPVKFYYNNKNWLITFWKGQYGIVTGAEVGIYCTNDKTVNNKTVYLPVDDSEMLNIYMALYKNDKLITTSQARHWWLAIFKLGMFSKPKELSMDINITFPNRQMLEAFLTSFKELGYNEKDYMVVDYTFYFRYIKPRTRKVWTRNRLLDSIKQHFNHKNTKLYNKYLSDFIENNGIDDSKTDGNKKIIMLNDFIPDLLKNNLNISKNLEQIAGKIYNETEKNIVFLDSHKVNNS